MKKYNFNDAESLKAFRALSKEEMITELIRSAHYTPFSDHVVELEKDITNNIRKLSSSSIAQIYKDLSSVANLKPTELAEKVLEVCGYFKAVSVAPKDSKQMITSNAAATNMMAPQKPVAETHTNEDNLKWLSENVMFGKEVAQKVQNNTRAIKTITTALKTVENMDWANIIPSPPEKVWKLIDVEAKYSHMCDMAFKAISKEGKQIIVHVNTKTGLFVPDKKAVA